MKPFTYFATAVAAIALAGCTVHQTEAPPLSGPSELALSLSMTSVPDTISQDGGSQASVKVTAKGPDGKAVSALPFRVEMRAPDASGNMVPQDFGTLSARTVVTGTDGVASVVYTAPAAPSGGITGTCNGLTGICVDIVMTPTSNNFSTAQSTTTTIRLVPPGVILPPAGTPTAAFTFTPTPVTQGSAVTFDGSGSTAGAGATQISTYAWSFGDGGSASGKTISHTFTSAASFNVTLTVTNDRGLSASSTQAVVVGALAVPVPKFVFSPTAPTAGQSVVFNADGSTAASGHNLTQFSWNFGDGVNSTASGIVTSHTFSAAGSYNVVLSVLDDAGQKGTTSQTVVVATASGGSSASAPTVDFVFSPSSPQTNQSVFFDASAARATSGHSLTSFVWNFGDGSTATTTTPTTTHTYTIAGTFNVVLTVTDDQNLSTTKTNAVTVTSTTSGLSAAFTISPTAPASGQLVTFNANTSTPLNQITQFDWDFGDGTVINGTAGSAGCQSSCGMIINHTFNTVNGGTFTIRLTVHDSTGKTATATNTAAVAAGADPTAAFSASPNPATLAGGGVNVTFTDSSSTAAPGNAITAWQWNFGDGSALATTQNPTHAYTAKGTYSVTLTVTQTNGRT